MGAILGVGWGVLGGAARGSVLELGQWFADGRLDLHPEVKDPRYRVAQGRVGYEYLHRLGLL